MTLAKQTGGKFRFRENIKNLNKKIEIKNINEYINKIDSGSLAKQTEKKWRLLQNQI